MRRATCELNSVLNHSSRDGAVPKTSIPDRCYYILGYIGFQINPEERFHAAAFAGMAVGECKPSFLDAVSQTPAYQADVS